MRDFETSLFPPFVLFTTCLSSTLASRRSSLDLFWHFYQEGSGLEKKKNKERLPVDDSRPDHGLVCDFRVVRPIIESNIFSAVDSTNLRNKVPQDVSSFQIRGLCKREDDDQIEVTFFKLPPALKEVLSTLGRVQESLTFKALWKKYGNKAQRAREKDDTRKRQLSICDVVENVWKPAITNWTQNVASVKDGTISLGDVDRLFDSYKNREKELEGELFCMFKVNAGQTVSNARELKKTVEERLAQIQRYQHLHQYSSAADTVWEFKEAMGFTGDFKVIEDLRNQVS